MDILGLPLKELTYDYGRLCLHVTERAAVWHSKHAMDCAVIPVALQMVFIGTNRTIAAQYAMEKAIVCGDYVPTEGG
jgi:hypothetical protein